MIVDCHCHAGRGSGFSGPWDTVPSLADYESRARGAGIRRTVLLPVFHEDYAVANHDLARIVSERPERYIGFAMVHPARDAGRVHALVSEAVGSWGFRGIKVHRRDGRITREVCETARRFRLPVIYDVMGETAPLELLARAFPDVSFVIPHLGSFSDDWSAQLSLIDHLVRHPNIHADTSGVRRFDVLRQAVLRAGPGKILFGSDGPWLHPGLELEKIRALRLPRAAQDRITGGNLLRLLHSTPPLGHSRSWEEPCDSSSSCTTERMRCTAGCSPRERPRPYPSAPGWNC
ncbi:amidohydrolase family protein [Streptomyces sp. NPDC042319]|uniref:amidohydrolase family protein n=1 Tax=Streptomyces sp. NPDC042319 TaxID=3154332 RepID=UPI0033EEE643